MEPALALIAASDLAPAAVWALTLTLFVVGFLGLVLPFVPGPLILFLATVLHTWLRPESGLSLWLLGVEALLLAAAMASDFFCGALGSRWFGGSRWGFAGVLVGGLVGMFFALPGLILGPLIGCFAFELILAGKTLQPAAKSTFGTAVGTGVGLVSRLTIGCAMVAVFFVGAFWK